MDSINIADAEGRLGELIDRVEAGEEIDITRDGRTVARLSASPRVSTTTLASPRKSVDIEALRASTDGVPMQKQSAGDFIRAMRDSDRY